MIIFYRWNLIVKYTEIFVERGEIVWGDPEPVVNKILTQKYCYELNKQSSQCDKCKDRFMCYTDGHKPTPEIYRGTTFWNR